MADNRKRKRGTRGDARGENDEPRAKAQTPAQRGARGGENDELRAKAQTPAQGGARGGTSRGKGGQAGGASAQADGWEERGEAVGREERALQRSQEQRRSRRQKSREQEPDAPAKTYVRAEPTPPFPEQHEAKPGLESELEPRPRYGAPGYRGAGRLADKVAIVTGGDSGIGRAVAVLYAREGADVAIVYLDEHGDAAETKQAVEAEGRRCVLIAGDVADLKFCRDAVQKVVRELGRVDILVNNAAYQEHQASIEDITDEQLDRTFRTNLFGYFHMVQAVLPHLGEGAAIVNSGSITALEGSKELLDYSATKGAIHAFTRSLAQNLLEKGIRVNAVAPGPVWTPLNPADRDAQKVSKFGKSVPMGRPAQPEELAPAYVFLASAVDSSYITGEVLPVTGGKVVP